MSTRWPDLPTLELLVAVSEQGSLSAAARSLDVAQPNASRSIARLERELGVSLLSRVATGSTLTDTGVVYVDWATTMLESARDFLLKQEALRAKRDSQLTVGASKTVAEHLMPVWLARLRASQPELKISLEVCNSAEVFARVAAHEFDTGLVESPSVPTGLHSVDVATDRLVVIVPRGHPWADGRAVSLQELAATPLVTREPGSGTRETLEQALDGYAMPTPTLEVTSNAAVVLSVQAGVGPAVLSALAVESAVQAGSVARVEVTGFDLRRRLRAVWAPPRELKGPAGDLVRIARTH